jgi:hypothetical protein
MFFLGNMTGSSSGMRSLVKSSFDLPKIMADAIEASALRQTNKIHKMFIKNFIWVANNISKENDLNE